MQSNYKKLALIISINAVIMFLLTYALIDDFSHFLPNINRGYMAGMMVAPMVVLMITGMQSMYRNKMLNHIITGFFLVIFISLFSLARTQGFVGNKQFLLSMIPHHSSAIVMCERSKIGDSEILELCKSIIKTQKDEIAQMKKILERF